VHQRLHTGYAGCAVSKEQAAATGASKSGQQANRELSARSLFAASREHGYATPRR